jgi:hypothetical protein
MLSKILKRGIDHIKEEEMSETCMGEIANVYKILVG